MDFSASNNIRRIAERTRLLDILSKRVKQNCTGLEDTLPGYGFRYSSERQFVRLPYPHMKDITIKTQITLKGTLQTIDIFLKFLSGQELSQNELGHLENYELHRVLAPTARKYILDFDKQVDPYINTLSNALSSCPGQNFVSKTSEAADYLLDFANRIQYLEELYKETTVMCPELKDTLPGYGFSERYDTSIPSYGQILSLPSPKRFPFTFRETMSVIRVYLKFLSGQELDNYDDAILTSARNSELSKFYYSILLDVSHGKYRINLDETLEPVIVWLEKSLDQCELYLENLYQPGGEIFQSAAQRYYEVSAQRHT